MKLTKTVLQDKKNTSLKNKKTKKNKVDRQNVVQTEMRCN